MTLVALDGAAAETERHCGFPPRGPPRAWVPLRRGALRARGGDDKDQQHGPEEPAGHRRVARSPNVAPWR